MESLFAFGQPRTEPAILVVRCRIPAVSVSEQFGQGIFRVRTEADGERAVASFVQHPPDLLVLDAGSEVVERVRFWNGIRLEHTAGPNRRPLLVLGRANEPHTEERALNGGADCFVAAPVSDALLLRRVLALLRRHCGSPDSQPTVY